TLPRTRISSALLISRAAIHPCDAGVGGLCPAYCFMTTAHRRFAVHYLFFTDVPLDLHFDEAQCIAQLRVGLDRMEAYYMSFKEKRSITTEAQLEVESFKDDFPNIYNQIDIRDWGPFTITIGPYYTMLVLEFYSSYRA
ncbi:hypothetical protein HAX54_029439, partial [Datura stramonium]|nr:hypothetical protein [Datura stramonium]